MLRCRLTITSPLPGDWGRIPFSPVIDFGRLIAQAGAQGVLDPNSIVVVNLASGTPVAFARSEDLAYGDRGRIEWTIDEPDHVEYEIRFATARLPASASAAVLRPLGRPTATCCATTPLARAPWS